MTRARGTRSSDMRAPRSTAPGERNGRAGEPGGPAGRRRLPATPSPAPRSLAWRSDCGHPRGHETPNLRGGLAPNRCPRGLAPEYSMADAARRGQQHPLQLRGSAVVARVPRLRGAAAAPVLAGGVARVPRLPRPLVREPARAQVEAHGEEAGQAARAAREPRPLVPGEAPSYAPSHLRTPSRCGPRNRRDGTAFRSKVRPGACPACAPASPQNPSSLAGDRAGRILRERHSPPSVA